MWIYERYYLYAGIIGGISIGSIIITTYQLSSSVNKLKNIPKTNVEVQLQTTDDEHNNYEINTNRSLDQNKVNIDHPNSPIVLQGQSFENNNLRNAERGYNENEKLIQKSPCASKFAKFNSEDIIPGDIIKIEQGIMLPCDIILMEGSCIVDE